ncbi:MAG TPA: pantoate--beta-alanine ligase [Spirochaetota bacterium]|jgi:pantoate--beta-alanine ligase|nr:pantoate--beta-alanine ligase [Spirochaetota bacterium]HOV08544.1 pantoate--beta-alanine ligase [Spirochaetota bacterium]
MEIVHKIDDVRRIISEAKRSGKKVGFVPTMGFLHDGHISLVEISKSYSDFQVMSIFVNRLQFNDINDFNTYPKDLQRDIEKAKAGGVDLLFVPDDSEMYKNNLTTVDVALLTDNLCGAHRPGHFKGVFTVVSKLFNIVQPDVAVFGQKDIQQAVSLEKMVFDLNFPIKMIIGPIKRESDGLAMSSRNKHLSEKERKDALALYRSLQKCEEILKSGENKAEKIIAEMTSVIKSGNPTKIDYISVVNYEDLQPVSYIQSKSVIAVAAFWGTTRLIDNMIVHVDDSSYEFIY